MRFITINNRAHAKLKLIWHDILGDSTLGTDHEFEKMKCARIITECYLYDIFESDDTTIIEYENGATLAFHTNMKVPDEFRRFAIIGTKGMVEGDFVRGYLTVHDSHSGKKIFDENFGAAFQQGTKGHYGADQLMVKDINDHLLGASSESLPVGVIDCMQAG